MDFLIFIRSLQQDCSDPDVGWVYFDDELLLGVGLDQVGCGGQLGFEVLECFTRSFGPCETELKRCESCKRSGQSAVPTDELSIKVGES